jgi:hypothetical protein
MMTPEAFTSAPQPHGNRAAVIRRRAWILPAAVGSALVGLAGGAVFGPGEDTGGSLLRP